MVVIGTIPVILFGTIILHTCKNEMIDNKMSRLQRQCNILKNHIISENYIEAKDSPAIDAELSQLSAMYDGRIMLINSDFVILKDTYVMDEGKTTISRDVIKCYKGDNISLYNEEEESIEIVLPLSNNDKEIMGVMYVSLSVKDVTYLVENIKKTVYFIQTVLIVVVIVFSTFWARKFVKPFDRLEKQVEKISYGYLDNKVSMDGYTETEELAIAFNGMLDRMRKIDDSRQEFVSNVSHELKTPITSIKVLADSLMGQEDIPNEIYKEFFTDIVAEVDRENEIITDLLALVRLDKKNTNLNISQVNINELVEMILKRLRPIAAKNNIEIVLETFRPIIAEVDEMKMSSVITNLVENAIKYNVMDGWVRVTLNADHKYFYIKVVDSGIGIPEESQEMIFERFYRVDKTRARETGGTGLGLAITKSIILLHNGVIKVYSKEGEGTTFNVRIPLNYVNEGV
jgi:signal transduction histidine kinase